MARAKDFVTASFEESLAAVRSAPLASAFNTKPSPDELNAIYSRGFQGLKPESTTFEQKRRWKDTIGAMPRLYDIFPWAKGISKDKLICPFVAIKHLEKTWGGQDAQERGDCTVHGTRNACAMDYGNDCLFGEAKYMGPIAVENIYRSRGFNGDGWSCEAPCSYVGPDGDGGLLYRKIYEGGGQKVDLSRYNPSWEGNGSAGVPSWMEDESRKSKVKWVIPITTEDEYFDALAIGFGINVCSGQGFSSETDENGVAAARGSWSHSMAHVAGDRRPWAVQKYGGPLGGIQQSWGDWNTINGKPPDSPEMPTGMFWAKFSVIMNNMLGDDSYAMCSVFGWERTNWEAFDVGSTKDKVQKLHEFFSDSTVMDYYKARQEAIEQMTQKVSAEGFLTI